jgi:hypothetical protein
MYEKKVLLKAFNVFAEKQLQEQKLGGINWICLSSIESLPKSMK